MIETVNVSQFARIVEDERPGFDTKWLVDKHGCPTCGNITKYELKLPTMPAVNVCKHCTGISNRGNSTEAIWAFDYRHEVEKKKKTAAAKPGEPNHCIKPHPHAGPCKLQHPEKCPDCKYETSDPQKLLIHGDRCPGKKKQKIYMAEVTLSSGRMGPKKLNSVTPLPVPESRKRKSKPVYHNPNSRQEDLFKFFPQNQAELSEWFEMERGGRL